jgi:hypothetical protein
MKPAEAGDHQILMESQCDKKAEYFNVKSSGIYNYHYVFKGYRAVETDNP